MGIVILYLTGNALPRRVLRVLKVEDDYTVVLIYHGVRERVRLIGIDRPPANDPAKPARFYRNDFQKFMKKMLRGRDVRVVPENYRRDMNRASRGIRITQNDMDRIKERLAGEFDTVFRGVFEDDENWTVVDSAAENVLVLRPAIINLDVAAPDTMSAGRTRTYTDTAGEMTIYLEVRDSVTGALLAKGLDRQADRRSGFMEWQTRSRNTQAARTILRGWAESLRDGLTEASEAARQD